jgi:hypothetical protein
MSVYRRSSDLAGYPSQSFMSAMAFLASASILYLPIIFMVEAGWLCIMVHLLTGGVEGHVELLGESRSDERNDKTAAIEAAFCEASAEKVNCERTTPAATAFGRLPPARL